jgi:acetyl-CoA acetyltransferase
MRNNPVWIAGVGMTPFTSPSQKAVYTDLASLAIREALADSGLAYTDIQQVYAGYVYGDSTSGQRAAYGAGLTGIPIINVNNNCATGSTALYLARQAIVSEEAECVLALGFEQMRPGAIAEHFADRPSPLQPFLDRAEKLQGHMDAPIALRLFGGAARDYSTRYGTSAAVFASVSVKSRRHAAANPRAVFRAPVTVEEVLSSPSVYPPLTRLQCCAPTCGAAAAILVSRSFARRRGLAARVSILSQVMATDTAATFSGDMIAAVGAAMTAAAAERAYEAAAVGPEDIGVIELHDCFTSNEILSYEALRLVEEGGAERLIHDGDNTYGGRWVVNPSGGLLGKGHPLGATGLAQCHELVHQLRGTAGATQVDGVALALQHNIGLGGACVVTIYGQTRA